MHLLVRLLSIAICVAGVGCGSADKANYDHAAIEAKAHAAADAAEAAADAAAAADASSAEGGNAAALRLMDVDHHVSEFTGDSASADVAMPLTTRVSRDRRVADKAMLAYEHTVTVRMAASRIAATVASLRGSCETGRYGACLLLGVEQGGGEYPRASLTMRVEPKVVEPLIAAAGEGGEIGDRSTRAEDLAVVVRDNAVLQDRLRKQQVRLLKFQERDDLKVADVIALAEQLSRIEAELEAAERDGATHKRRIETQLLTIALEPSRGETGRSDIAMALRDTGGTMAASTAGVIRVVAGLIPILLALWLAIWVAKRLWRWSRRKASTSSQA